MPSQLFSPITIPAPQGPGLTLRNRAAVPPMCQFELERQDGIAREWHQQHYGALAAGGFGLITVESTGVEPRGRISPADLGLWNDEQTAAHAKLVDFMHSQGVAAAIQLNHAGGKAGTWPERFNAPDGTVPVDQGGWQTLGVTDQRVFPELDAPQALDAKGIAQIVEDFRQAAVRADAAGYDAIQIHGAHGYLIHQFLSPLTNTRTDEYGGDLEGRSRFMREVVDAVRSAWPATKPLGIRVSATDWTDKGLSADEVAAAMRELVDNHGITWVDVSSGGLDGGPIPVGHGYQLPGAQTVKQALAGTGALVAGVGLITDAAEAETIIESGTVDLVDVGRAALRNPHWAAVAARRLHVPIDKNPVSPYYWRAFK